MPRTAKSETDAGVTMVTRVEAWGVQRTKDEILAKLMPVKRRRGTAAVIDSTLTSDVSNEGHSVACPANPQFAIPLPAVDDHPGFDGDK